MNKGAVVRHESHGEISGVLGGTVGLGANSMREVRFPDGDFSFPVSELELIQDAVIKKEITTKRTKKREIVRRYINVPRFITFAEYLQLRGYSLTVETSNQYGFEIEYENRLGTKITLPDSALQTNKWGTQIRLHFTIPEDRSLIPFEEAPAGVGGSYARGHEVWINNGKGRGEITNQDFNWELRERGLMFDFEKEQEVDLADIA